MSGSPRLAFEALPRDLVAAVEAILGSPVVAASTQTRGFSPGSADRVRLADGRRAFVKAVSSRLNAQSVVLHRQEARALTLLPDAAPAPRLWGVHDTGEWVALVMDDVDSRHPDPEWTDANVTATLDAIASLVRITLDAGVGLPGSAEQNAADLALWGSVEAGWPDLDPWLPSRLASLDAASRGVVPLMVGDHPSHGDLRADNVLLTASGAVLVDWAHLTRGAVWLDAALVLSSVLQSPGADVEVHLSPHPVFDAVGRRTVVATLAGLWGYFEYSWRRPAPPGLPTLRAFQRTYGDNLGRWVKAHWEE